MFYGLNNIIKKILPKRLFYRSLVIVATPIILLQIIITVVFFDSLWIKANKGMTRSLVGEVKTLIDAYKYDQDNKQKILDLYHENFDFVVTIKENEILPKTKEIGKENKDFRFIPANGHLNKSRLVILKALAIVIRNGMYILGVSTPKSM